MGEGQGGGRGPLAQSGERARRDPFLAERSLQAARPQTPTYPALAEGEEFGSVRDAIRARPDGEAWSFAVVELSHQISCTRSYAPTRRSLRPLALRLKGNRLTSPTATAATSRRRPWSRATC